MAQTQASLDGSCVAPGSEEAETGSFRAEVTAQKEAPVSRECVEATIRSGIPCRQKSDQRTPAGGFISSFGPGFAGQSRLSHVQGHPNPMMCGWTTKRTLSLKLPVCSDNINEIYESEVVQWFTLLKGVNH